MPGRVFSCRGADDAYPVTGDLQRFRKVMRKEVSEPSCNLSEMVDVAMLCRKTRQESFQSLSVGMKE